LPLHGLLEAFAAWQAEPGEETRERVEHSFRRLASAYEVRGAFLLVHVSTLSDLEVGFGSLEQRPAKERRAQLAEHVLHSGEAGVGFGHLLLDGEAGAVALAARAVELALDSVWSRAEARESERRLAALDAAVRGIAGVLSVQRVLQLIVDRVRELVGAQYAALGVVGPLGIIESFITSGMSEEQVAKIGHLPEGRGLLGLIVRENRSLRIDDIATDPRRYGFPAHHPEMHAFLGVPVWSKGLSIGNLYLTNKRGGQSFSENDQRLVEMFALHAAIAIENARLHEEVERLAIVDERQRIGRDLHDSIIQSLYAVGLSLEDLPELMAENRDEANERLDANIDAIHQTIRDIRNFILNLSPEMLDEADLATSVESLAAEFRLNTMIDLDVDVSEGLAELSAASAAHLLAMTREGLSNIARHSHATRASLELKQVDSTLRLIIGDNGRGFDVEAARGTQHRGLANLRSRAEAMGGSLSVHSEPSAGTRLVVSLPADGRRQQQETTD
jgi:signal transduction histidine kinase